MMMSEVVDAFVSYARTIRVIARERAHLMNDDDIVECGRWIDAINDAIEARQERPFAIACRSIASITRRVEQRALEGTRQ